jgi:hypothetical protein
MWWAKSRRDAGFCLPDVDKSQRSVARHPPTQASFAEVPEPQWMCWLLSKGAGSEKQRVAIDAEFEPKGSTLIEVANR